MGMLALAAAAVLAVPAGAKQNLTLQVVLDRLGRYLADYAERLPATIAAEHYKQRSGRRSIPDERVVLESELGIMRLGHRVRERQRPTISKPQRADVAIDNESTHIGFIAKVGFTATIDVVLKDKPSVGFRVPSEMTERYEGRDMTPSSGEAIYGNYRNFSVDTRVIVSSP